MSKSDNGGLGPTRTYRREPEFDNVGLGLAVLLAVGSVVALIAALLFLP